jgi:hypothetical protein
VARAYARLEALVRECIDPVAGRVCPTCPNPCCRGHYCRETARNPWYRFVGELAGGFEMPRDALLRRDPFGLGEAGCSIRAGRYAFCYSYNCRRILESLSCPARAAFQEVSDLLLAPNRLPGGRLLHEVRRCEEIGERDLLRIAREVTQALDRLPRLRAFLVDPTPPPEGLQECGRRNP